MTKLKDSNVIGPVLIILPQKTSRPTDTHSLIEVNQWALESLTSIARDKIEKSTST